MAQFSTITSRRQFLNRAALAGAGGLLAGFPNAVFARANGVEQWPRVRAMIEHYVTSGKIANMIATLGWGQDAPLHIARGARAYTGGGRVNADSIYRIYSMTKPVTGMAAMICIDEGLMRLDQPIADFLPAFAEMQVQKTYDGPVTQDNLEPARRPITIRHLLTHTAGLGYTIVQQGPLRDAYNAAGIVPGAVTRLPLPEAVFGRRPASSLAQFADQLAGLPLAAQPGSRWLYSVSLDLLARVIELASGQPFERFVQDRILGPCGMASTGFRVARNDAARLTTSYFYTEGIPLPIDLPQTSIFLDSPPFPFGGAGLVSTARDYDRFLRMLAGYGAIGGKRVMSEAAVRLGTSDLLPDTLLPGGKFRGGAFGHGAGGMVGLAGTMAEGLFGWTGAAGTAGFVNLKLGLRMNAMVQYMPYDLYDIPEQFPLTVAADVAAQSAAMRVTS